MGDILEETSALLQCKECAWYKWCITPMRFTAEDLKREMESALSATDSASGLALRQLLSNMAALAENLMLEGCPIFVRRLKSSSRLAEKLKKMMQTWGEEEQTPEKGLPE